MVKNIVITGACGQIAYSLIASLLQGAFIKSKFNLKLLDIAPMMDALKGLKMEIEDMASPYLKDVMISCDPGAAFKEGDYFFFLGAFPRGPGMERRDLLEKNAGIFIEQGFALNHANSGAKVVVVGNPCNTNALILHKKLKRNDVLVTSMSMLDHLRAKSYIAHTLEVPVDCVENLIIWGNHSKSLYVDTHYATALGRNVHQTLETINFEHAMQTHTQKRGEEVIKARGKSSAASAANAALEHMKALIVPSRQFFSCGVHTKGNLYNLDDDLFFSMPCIVNGQGELEVATHLSVNAYRHHFEPSLKELQEERSVIEGML